MFKSKCRSLQNELRPRTVLLILISFLSTSQIQAQDKPDFCTFPYACPIAGRVSPQVGQQGTTVDVLLQGGRLDQVKDALFYQPGIRFVGFELTEEVPDDRRSNIRRMPPGTAGILTLQIDKECPAGEHFFRIVTNDALSEMLSFWVTPWPCVAEIHQGADTETSSNGTFENAQPVKLGTTLYGYHPEYSTIDYDFYSVDLLKGQRLTVEIWSACLGFEHHRGLTDIAVTVYGPDRKKIAYEDDSSLRDMDPLVNLVAPEAGTYFINIHQNMDFEGTLRHYVAHIGDGQRPKVTYPAGGQAGSTLRGIAIGDALGTTDFQLRLPASPGRFEKSLIDYHVPGSVIPNRIQVASFPDVLEDGNDHFQPENAQVFKGNLPVAFNGRIEHEGKTDWFRFSAKKGERYRIRTYASTIGSSLDARLVVRPAESTNSRINIEADDSKWIDHDWWGNDKVWFIRDRMDPITIFEPDADGDYLIGISDAQRLSGHDYIYRIEFQPVRDHAFVYFPTDYREAANKRDRLVIPRGNTIEHTFAIVHATGSRYRGGMRMIAEGLPDGVTFNCPDLKPGQTLTQATLTASADAEPWAGLIDIRLEPTEPDVEFSGSYVHNISSTRRRGGYSVVFNRVRKCALAIVQEAPLRVRVKQPEVGLAQNAVIDLEVEVERTNGFTGPVRAFAAWTPPGVTIDLPLVIPAGETRGTYRLRAAGNVTPGTYPITMTAHEHEGGEQTWGTGFHYVASSPINLEVVRPYLDIQLARAAIERQKTGTINATIKTINPLPGTATARLVRLPKGVELIEPEKIRPGDKEATFSVRITKDCLLGQYKEIGCEITIEDRGQVITQQTGNGTLRVDAERGVK